MQNEITERRALLDGKGTVLEPGWARRPHWEYRRSAVRANPFRIKEWDYYCVLDGAKGVSFTVADNGYFGYASATVFDFGKPAEWSDSVLTWFTFGKLGMPESSDAGDVRFSAKGANLSFLLRDGLRVIEVDWPGFSGGKGLSGRVELAQPDSDSMTIATPFPKRRRAFYYNRKINCLPASGILDFGGTKLSFEPERAQAVLDWGRGVWTYDNTWYWGSCSGRVNGVPFGLNLGYGFGDTSAATENVILYAGKAHKIGNVEFSIPGDSFMKPWKVSSDDGRLDLVFTPVLDRAQRANYLVIESDQHQVFGRFDGKAVLDDGTALSVGGILGFAEKVRNRW